MLQSPTELEQRVADVVLGALRKDEAKGYVVTAEGRQAIIKLFKSFTTYEVAHAAAQEMMRCALYVHKHLACKSAAVDLMNTFALIGPAPGRGVPVKNSEDMRRTAAKKFLAVAPQAHVDRSTDDVNGLPWWQVLAK